jgi:hypothetical protein
MRLIRANQMSPNLIFNCAVRLDPGFAIGESSAGPFAGAVTGSIDNLRLIDIQMFK